MPLLRRTRLSLDGPCVQRPIGLGSLGRGLGVLPSSFLTVKRRCVSTGRLLWISSELHQRIHSLPSRLMCVFETSTPRNCSILGIRTSSTFLSLLRCFLLPHQLLLAELSMQRCLSQMLQEATRSVQTFLVRIGALVCAKLRYAQTIGSMASVAFVVKDIEQRTTRHASVSSKLVIDQELLEA
jgi:hypothetical protein